jgi:hypothetical protein
MAGTGVTTSEGDGIVAHTYNGSLNKMEQQLQEALTDEDIEAIVEVAIADAVRGDADAREWVTAHLIEPLTAFGVNGAVSEFYPKNLGPSEAPPWRPEVTVNAPPFDDPYDKMTDADLSKHVHGLYEQQKKP